MSTLEFVSPPVRYFHIAVLGWALAPVEFENSSDQTSVPGAIFGVRARLETLNQGMLLGVARAVDVGASIQWLRYMAGWATKIHGDSIDISFAMPPGTKYQAIVRREPVGVVGAIVPWNFPLLMAIWKIAPALACGCTVVLKPASDTPLTALRFAELALEAGIPPGVLNVIIGSGATTGAALVQHPDVNKITLTGSTEVGIWIGQQCATTVKRVALELGGKSPVIVLDDCDPAAAAAGASAAIFFNQGQVCTAGSRLYVQKKQFERVVEGLLAFSKRSRVVIQTMLCEVRGMVPSDEDVDDYGRLLARLLGGGALMPFAAGTH